MTRTCDNYSHGRPEMAMLEAGKSILFACQIAALDRLKGGVKPLGLRQPLPSWDPRDSPRAENISENIFEAIRRQTIGAGWDTYGAKYRQAQKDAGPQGKGRRLVATAIGVQNRRRGCLSGSGLPSAESPPHRFAQHGGASSQIQIPPNSYTLRMTG